MLLPLPPPPPPPQTPPLHTQTLLRAIACYDCH
jgi:hypothetical protein